MSCSARKKTNERLETRVAAACESAIHVIFPISDPARLPRVWQGNALNALLSATPHTPTSMRKAPISILFLESPSSYSLRARLLYTRQEFIHPDRHNQMAVAGGGECFDLALIFAFDRKHDDRSWLTPTGR